MGDIATEAGVARQTLYNSYSNKDDVLRGSIRLFGHDAMQRLNDELSNATRVSEKVDLVLDEMVVKPYVFLHSSPNAQDLIDGYNAAGRSEMEANYQAFEDHFAAIFEPFSATLKANELTPRELAELLRRSATAVKYQAQDEAHMLKLVTGLSRMVAATVGEKS